MAEKKGGTKGEGRGRETRPLSIKISGYATG